MNYYLGIDPGMSGGYALLGEDRVPVFCDEMPTTGKIFDVHAYISIMRDIHAWVAQRGGMLEGFIEAASARPGQGVSTMFKFGRVYGFAEAGVAGADIPYELVTPAKWTHNILAGIEGGDKAKSRNIAAAKRLFPSTEMRSSPKCKNLHEGIVDALLIAEFGRRVRAAK